FFFFNDPPTTEIYTTRHTLSLHDALPIYRSPATADFRADRRTQENSGDSRHRQGHADEHARDVQRRPALAACRVAEKVSALHARSSESSRPRAQDDRSDLERLPGLRSRRRGETGA